MPPPERTNAVLQSLAICDNGVIRMKFDPTAYGPLVASILALDGNGERLMPLASGRCSCAEALTKIQTTAPEALFPNSRAPQAAISGLYLYFSCFDQAHEV